MEPYLFLGVVRPERAQITLKFDLEFMHITSGAKGLAKVSIVLNQILVCIESDHIWDIFDLRNVVKNILQGELAMVGFIKGYAYDVEITRVIMQSREIDFVFGIDIPCIAERNKLVDLNECLQKIRCKIAGENGIFLKRCFVDSGTFLPLIIITNPHHVLDYKNWWNESLNNIKPYRIP